MKLEEAHKLHRELWEWLAETGQDKYGWPKWKEIDRDDMPGSCFACAIVLNAEGKPDCKKCPIGWGKHKRCPTKNSIYKKWIMSTNEEGKKYAAIIRDLPWKRIDK